jgi:hypothetical protein
MCEELYRKDLGVINADDTKSKRGSSKRCKWCGKPTPRRVHPCGSANYAETCQSKECNKKSKEYQAARVREVLTGNTKHYDKRRKHFSAICLVCGLEFSVKHNETGDSNPRKTCSNECLKKYRLTHNVEKIRGYAARESEEECYSRTEATFNREQTAVTTKRGSSNCMARSFLLIAPDGERFEGCNVTNFVRTNPHLFTEYELQLTKPKKKLHGYSDCIGTRQPICISRLTAVLRGAKGSYHGWTGFYID